MSLRANFIHASNVFIGGLSTSCIVYAIHTAVKQSSRLPLVHSILPSIFLGDLALSYAVRGIGKCVHMKTKKVLGLQLGTLIVFNAATIVTALGLRILTPAGAAIVGAIAILPIIINLAQTYILIKKPAANKLQDQLDDSSTEPLKV